MYEEYYGFVQPPFSLTPDPRFLYRSESHDVALQQVWQAIRRKEGFIVLTGDIGTGKTTLCRTLLEQFDATTFTALILNPFLSVEELLREVLLSFGVTSREALHTGRLATASKHELVRTLHDFLLSLIPLHSSAVLIIDEAQHLSAEVLEEIRILSNLETTDQKLLQIVLVGQLNLLDVLHQQNMRQLDQRISIRCMLKPLNREEVEAYITHRLWVARGSTSVVFTPAGLDMVHAITGGVPRMINLVCDRGLMAGREAEVDKVTDAEIVAGAEALGLPVPKGAQRREQWKRAGVRARRAGLVATLVVIAAAAGAAVFLLGNPLEWLANTPPTPPAAPAARALAAPLAVPGEPGPGVVLTPPTPVDNSLALVFGRFDNADDAGRLADRLAGLGLPVYLVDVRLSPTELERRVLVGRYRSRGEAASVQAEYAADFPGIQLIPGWREAAPDLPR